MNIGEQQSFFSDEQKQQEEDRKKILEKQKKLTKTLAYHAHNYYDLDTPTIADREYDALYDELVLLEKKTGVIFDNSPTQRVGGGILTEFKKYPHRFRLYSLDKCQTRSELEKWVADVKELVPDATFTCEYKFDGLSLVCHYKNGELISAGTRGNGFVGEEVTEQAKTIKTVPQKIDFKGELIVQGEAMMTLSSLKKYNETADEPLKNARNAAAGAIRNLNTRETAKRNLDWFAYTIHYAENINFKTQIDMFDFLRKNGFNIGEFCKVCASSEEICKQIDFLEETKANLDILIDGMVIRLNEITPRDEIGETNKFPKWAMAYKFEAEEVTSLLEDVQWQVGRTGKITPIGIVEAVELAGATIRRATLNNYGDIERKKIEIGSRVFIRRSNEVIPEILGIAEKLPNSKKIKKPKICPCCKSNLYENGAHLFCPNTAGCKDQVVDRLVNFASKNGFDIEGLSEGTIEKLYSNPIIHLRQFHEIFELTGQEFKLIESGTGKSFKQANKLFLAVERAKNISLDKFIYALGISEVGVKTAKDLAKSFKTLASLMSAAYEDIEKIYNIGDVVAENIYKFFKDAYNLDEIQKLLNLGVKIIYEKEEKLKDTIFNGKKVVITGTMQSFTRQQLTSLLEKLNAQVVGTVSKNTDYLICGDAAGSKLEKAISLDIKIINEDELKKLI